MNKIHTSIIISGFIVSAVLGFSLYGSSSVLAAVVCSGGNCSYVACNANSDCGTNKYVQWAYSCQSNNLHQDYITYTCNNPGSGQSFCTNTRQAQLIQTCNSNQKCQVGLWNTGCQAAINTTPTNTTPTNTTPINTTPPSVSCSSHYFQKCVGNSLYWFNSCGSQQDLYQTCSYGQTCSNNSCTTANYTSQNYTSHAIKGCINNSVYWYDSLGSQQNIYQNCSYTGQTCYNGKCIGQVYTQVKPAQVKPAVKTTPQPSYKVGKDLTISIFGKKASDPLQWEKNVTAADNDKVEFLLTVKNISDSPIDDVSVKVNITKDVDYNNDLKIDDVSSEEDIELGVNLGSIPQKTSKALSFTGIVQSEDTQKEIKEVKIIGTINSGSLSDIDFFTIHTIPPSPSTPQNQQAPQVENKTNSTTASVGDSQATNLFKRWYVWLAIVIVLASLFVVIFKKLSSNV